MKRVRFTTRTLAAIVAIVAVALFIYGEMPVEYLDGAFELTVHWDCEDPASIASIEYDAAQYRQHAEVIAANFDSAGVRRTRVTMNVAEFVAFIPRYGRANGFGRELSYGEFHYLILRARFNDGTQQIQIVEIPAGRGPRRVSASIERPRRGEDQSQQR